MKTFLMSTLALATMTSVALADASQPATGRLELSDAQMDQLTAGKRGRWVKVVRLDQDTVIRLKCKNSVCIVPIQVGQAGDDLAQRLRLQNITVTYYR